MKSTRPLTFGAIALLAAAVVLPAFAAKPSSPPGQAKEKVPSTPITLNGTVRSAAGAEGDTVYTLADAGTTYTLDAGPSWFFDAGAHPLDAFVGDAVTIEGEKKADSNEVDVISVNGTALREAGKPPWAGGWKRVGERHPGWSQEKADRHKAKFGDCFPPGQCKDKPNRGADESASPD